MTDKVVLGTIGGAFGVHGEVRLKSFCAIPEDIADYTPLETEKGRVFNQIVLTGRTKNGLTARLDGVTTKEEADALRNTELFAPRDRLPPTDDDEFYYADLIGLPVFDTGGEQLGTVRAVQNHGAGDLLEIHAPGRSTTILLPFTQEAVPTVDLTAGRIVADPPEGLF
ncbi:ribosome maturation factor RimM [Aestuariibius sp. 2305UL40-4]|uniref:ribosome maturation factor RimM n=1 Tax=Aestuariibius violaceus TaxID=3234132 RepID=UPI00345E1978